MDLFGEKTTAIVFEKASLRKTKDGAKVAKMRFAVRLEAEALLNSPDEVRAGFEAVEQRENGITLVELGDKEISGVNVEFFNLPDSRAVSAALQSVNLTNLQVERQEQNGMSHPHFTFNIEVMLDEKAKLRYWIVDNIFNQLWAKFEVAQRVLIPKAASDEVRQKVN